VANVLPLRRSAKLSRWKSMGANVMIIIFGDLNMNTNFLLKIPILLKINVMVFFPLHKGM
jgi:hypothetical protein